MESKKQKLIGLVLLIFVTLSLSGGGGIAKTSPPPEPLVVPIGESSDLWGMGELTPGEKGGVISFGLLEFPRTLNPLVAVDPASGQVIELIMGAGLVERNPVNGRIVPAFAKSWEVSPDGKTYTFHIRHGLRFSDGHLLTAEDVVFTFRDLIFNDGVETDLGQVLTVQGRLPQIKAVDRYTVQFITPVSWGPFIQRLGIGIFPKHLWEGIPGEKVTAMWGEKFAAENPDKIVGAGPFVLNKFIPGQAIELKPNPHYYKVDPKGRQLPYLSTIRLLKADCHVTNLAQFKAGRVDFFNPYPEDIPFLFSNRKQEGWEIMVKRGAGGAPLGTDFVGFNWNCSDELLARFFARPDFRRAVSYAINRNEIVDEVFNGMGEIQDSPISRFSPYYRSKAADNYPHQFKPGKAGELLSNMGLIDIDDDSIRELPGGGDFSFELITNSDNPVRLKMGRIIRKNLAHLGLKVEFNGVSFDELIRRVFRGDFQAVLINTVNDPLQPHTLYDLYAPSGDLHFWNRGESHQSTSVEKQIEELFEKGRLATSFNERRRLYNEFQQIVTENVPLIYTAGEVFTFAHDKTVRNTATFGTIGSFFGHAEYLWLDDQL